MCDFAGAYISMGLCETLRRYENQVGTSIPPAAGGALSRCFQLRFGHRYEKKMCEDMADISAEEMFEAAGFEIAQRGPATSIDSFGTARMGTCTQRLVLNQFSSSRNCSPTSAGVAPGESDVDRRLPGAPAAMNSGSVPCCTSRRDLIKLVSPRPVGVSLAIPGDGPPSAPGRRVMMRTRADDQLAQSIWSTTTSSPASTSSSHQRKPLTSSPACWMAPGDFRGVEQRVRRTAANGGAPQVAGGGSRAESRSVTGSLH